jgi:hypothetical protein
MAIKQKIENSDEKSLIVHSVLAQLLMPAENDFNEPCHKTNKAFGEPERSP